MDFRIDLGLGTAGAAPMSTSMPIVGIQKTQSATIQPADGTLPADGATAETPESVTAQVRANLPTELAESGDTQVRYLIGEIAAILHKLRTGSSSKEWHYDLETDRDTARSQYTGITGMKAGDAPPKIAREPGKKSRIFVCIAAGETVSVSTFKLTV